MANTNADIIRVFDTLANLPGKLNAGQWGYDTTNDRIGVKRLADSQMVYFDATGDANPTDITINDNDAAAFKVRESSNNYIAITTLNGTEAMTFGNTTTNPGFKFDAAAKIYLNDSSNAKMTVGLTINQDANDDEIICFKSSDVSHPFTDFAEADTYGSIAKYSGPRGGLYISGFQDSAHTSPGVQIRGWISGDDPTYRAVIIDARMTDGGTGSQAVADTTSIIDFENASVTKVSILGSGLIDALGGIYDSAGSLDFQADAGQNITMFKDAAIDEIPELQIWGYPNCLAGATHISMGFDAAQDIFRFGNINEFGFGEADANDVDVYFYGDTNNGKLSWKEDEDYFQFNDDILMNSTEKILYRDAAIGTYSQADGYYDIFADTGVRIGNSSAGAPTTYQQWFASGKTIFVGAGTGLPYGSCYGNEIAWASGAAAQNTWYNIVDTDMTDGHAGLNETTHDGNGKITVTYAGVYEVLYSVTLEASVANKHIMSGIELSGSGSAIGDGQAHWNSSLNEEVVLSGVAQVDLAASATIEIAVRTTDTGTPTITVSHLNYTVKMLGGT